MEKMGTKSVPRPVKRTESLRNFNTNFTLIHDSPMSNNLDLSETKSVRKQYFMNKSAKDKQEEVQNEKSIIDNLSQIIKDDSNSKKTGSKQD
jgi:hypothetical protein